MATKIPLKIESGDLKQFASTDTIPVGNLATGTPTSSNYLRGDGTWAEAGGGSGTFTGGTVTGTTNITDTTASTNDITGALTVTGGVGISGALNVKGNVGYVNSVNAIKAYTYYNAGTSSIDTVFI